jgi:hypothetical protein
VRDHDHREREALATRRHIRGELATNQGAKRVDPRAPTRF